MGIGPATLIILAIVFLFLSHKRPSASIYQSTDLPWVELVRSRCVLSTVVAVAALAPACVWLLGRVQGRLALRLTCRDLLRQSLRSIPASAALGSIIFVATALSVSNRAQSDAEFIAAESAYPIGSFILALENGLPEDLDDAVSVTEKS